ncbi:hypothetical protein [Erythrobacter oryzae]|uniref:hypothetical protein n=1 Tax=Erythrobacter oryzae TaxID=3019556 RepID=UPI002556896C|nr:hypothetical protein [Erythrobacter sp. COR-2]
MKASPFLALALIAAPAAAQVGPQPMFDAGEELEVELHADFNGDGHADVAYIVRGDDKRELRVATTFITEVEIGENPPQVLALDPYPLADARLSETDSAKGKVLVLEDLTGGTTAVSSTHRFRWDARLEAMRLIGLDATLYSRTYAHDGKEASWNLLTGDLVTRTLRLNKGPGDQAYDTVGETKRKKPSPPLRLENSPSGDDLLGWPGAK